MDLFSFWRKSPTTKDVEADFISFTRDFDDWTDALSGTPGRSRQLQQEEAQRRTRETRRKLEAQTAIDAAFKATNETLVATMDRTGMAGYKQARATHKEVRREALKTAIALFGRRTVEEVLRDTYDQDLFRDYDISYFER